MGLFDEFKGFDVQEERRNGEEIKLIKLVCKKIIKGHVPEIIAEELDEDEEHIKRIYDAALKYAPDYDADKIFEELSKEKTVV
ncbi:MAG: hypothetical protein IJI01_01080 [Butyrivibrio sp.]|jgi:hypothetical protein|uniref:hypothetical protein n=1 Tax=Butyrivibrio sp. TaxID=28121 RepID=UPI0025C5630F|nr:hypothetical protein [Butyrivibrio sp.]MBQ6587253.1 hypothetical protein [Butyrivibrio sp.]